MIHKEIESFVILKVYHSHKSEYCFINNTAISFNNWKNQDEKLEHENIKVSILPPNLIVNNLA